MLACSRICSSAEGHPFLSGPMGTTIRPPLGFGSRDNCMATADEGHGEVPGAFRRVRVAGECCSAVEQTALTPSGLVHFPDSASVIDVPGHPLFRLPDH